MTFLIIFLSLISLVTLHAIRGHLIGKWGCKIDWHLRPDKMFFDGVSNYGICPRCKAKIIQDSHGEWFAARRYQ